MKYNQNIAVAVERLLADDVVRIGGHPFVVTRTEYYSDTARKVTLSAVEANANDVTVVWKLGVRIHVTRPPMTAERFLARKLCPTLFAKSWERATDEERARATATARKATEVLNAS